MKLFNLAILFYVLLMSSVYAEVVTEESDALSIYGEACEEFKADEQNASTRLKATDKASYGAVSSLAEIVNIKDSFDEHDYNMLIYTLVDEYIEDMSTKTTRQDQQQICVEVSGYITPENIGKAIDETIKSPQVLAENSDTPKEINTESSLETLSNDLSSLPVLEEPPSDVVIFARMA